MNKTENLQKAEDILLDIKLLQSQIKETKQVIRNYTHILYSFQIKDRWEHILQIKEMSLKRLKIRFNNILKSNLFLN